MAEQQLIGIRLLALCSWLSLLFWIRYTHFCIGQQYHNLLYLCLACITLGYAYFKEMNTLQIDLSCLRFWSQLLFWGDETCIWHKNPTYIHFLRPCVCLSIMDLLLNLDYLVCLSKIHISHCTHIVGILIFSCQMALRFHHFILKHWSQSTEWDTSNSREGPETVTSLMYDSRSSRAWWQSAISYNHACSSCYYWSFAFS